MSYSDFEEVRDGKTGFTIPAEEPGPFCEKLSWLLNHPELHQKMGGQAAEYAQHYASEKIAKQIVLVMKIAQGDNFCPEATR